MPSLLWLLGCFHLSVICLQILVRIFAFYKSLCKNHIFILGSSGSGQDNKYMIVQLQNIMIGKGIHMNLDNYNSTKHFQSTIFFWLWLEYPRLVGFILVYGGDDEIIMPEANVFVFLKRF